ncbi:hypothetical protein OF829_12085 [Sphingomonas sp. LB-2]|uniref:hypothetical protein n=1 Tax=Sphingomonas caeni TaxID=2984949 RepID=UPI00222ED632|nr:hypothetical protein [Sphingomonas caeni]MCW3847979.1 hypothetical protein [Sphingomonas caeni]
MRALWAAAALGLTAAAPPADLTPAASCTLPRAETEAAFKALSLLGTEDDTEADERGTIYSFTGGELWGASPKHIRLSDYANPAAGDYSQSFQTAPTDGFAATRARLLAAHGKAQCDRDTASACELSLAPDGAWSRSVTLTESGGELLLVCTFTKRG